MSQRPHAQTMMVMMRFSAESESRASGSCAFPATKIKPWFRVLACNIKLHPEQITIIKFKNKGNCSFFQKWKRKPPIASQYMEIGSSQARGESFWDCLSYSQTMASKSYSSRTSDIEEFFLPSFLTDKSVFDLQAASCPSLAWVRLSRFRIKGIERAVVERAD